ncbi:hypothetical protein [Tsuneonella suprasediminis]|uniref:ATP-binding protein n=1 Tax=Tsuneonella suprasediminis TaxID=2306996 RepID=UPI002F928575
MTSKPNVYLIGASCAGVSTLGSLLSERFGVQHIDVDDYYWMPTDPPFSTKRAPSQRVRLIQDRQDACEGWVLSGSFMGWGDVLIQEVDLIVFLQASTPVRLQRLDQREAARHGSRILPGGDMHEAHLTFRDWASRYDDPSFTGRNLAQHQQWLNEQSAPVLRLNGEQTTEKLADQVEEQLLRQA